MYLFYINPFFLYVSKWTPATERKKCVTRKPRIVAKCNRPILTTKAYHVCRPLGLGPPRLSSLRVRWNFHRAGAPAYGIRELMRNRTDLQSHEIFHAEAGAARATKVCKSEKKLSVLDELRPCTGETSRWDSRSALRAESILWLAGAEADVVMIGRCKKEHDAKSRNIYVMIARACMCSLQNEKLRIYRYIYIRMRQRTFRPLSI